VLVLVAAISPYAQARGEARSKIGDFIEVHVDCPLAECERRDVKGLYAKARAGLIPAFTGVSDPYEPPSAPELVLPTLRQSPAQSAGQLLSYLEARGYVPPVGAQPPIAAGAAER
jgi:adenylylsulfate kinase